MGKIETTTKWICDICDRKVEYIGTDSPGGWEDVSVHYKPYSEVVKFVACSECCHDDEGGDGRNYTQCKSKDVRRNLLKKAWDKLIRISK